MDNGKPCLTYLYIGHGFFFNRSGTSFFYGKKNKSILKNIKKIFSAFDETCFYIYKKKENLIIYCLCS